MLKSFYGTKEAGTYWSAAYSGDWKQKVGVTSSTLDPCFMTATCNQAKDAPHGIAAILVDDTLITGNKHFAKAEELMHSNYNMRQTQTVTNGSQINFGGVQIGQDPDGTLRISEEAYIENLSNIKADLHNDIASVRTARGKVSWIATWTRPDAAFAMKLLSHEATKSCNDLNDYFKKTVKRNLIFCKLNVKSLHVVFYSDASFAGNLDLSSQIGGIILLKNKHGNAHDLHLFSKKFPRVTGSVLAAEIIGFVTAFDMASALPDVLEQIYQQSIPLYGLTDSYSFFSTVTQYNALREKSLSIEDAVVREDYAKFELANLGFVRTAYNLADPMTKHVKNTHLEKLLETGVVDHPVEEYITRA
jgi:hypothetical protein